MITVVHVNTERTWRGGEGQVFHLVRHLSEHGVRSIVAAPLKSALMDKVRSMEIPAIILRSTGEISFRQFQDLWKGARTYGADIFHVHTSHGLISAALAKFFCRRPLKVVYSKRTDFPLKTRFMNFSVKKYLIGADKILAVSNAIKNILIADGVPSDKVETIYSGIDVRAFEPDDKGKAVRSELGLDFEKVLVTMVAALAPHKDPLTFFRASELLADRYPQAVFLLIGAGELWNDLQNAVHKSPLKDRFLMLGFRNDIKHILAASDIFCMSSKMEGLCTSILDAMAMAKPVVATRAGGIPEVVVDGVTGWLTPIRNPSAMAEKIADLIDGSEQRLIMGKAGRKRVETVFDIRETVRKTAAVYENLLSGTEGTSN